MHLEFQEDLKDPLLQDRSRSHLNKGPRHLHSAVTCCGSAQPRTHSPRPRMALNPARTSKSVERAMKNREVSPRIPASHTSGKATATSIDVWKAPYQPQHPQKLTDEYRAERGGQPADDSLRQPEEEGSRQASSPPWSGCQTWRGRRDCDQCSPKVKRRVSTEYTQCGPRPAGPGARGTQRPLPRARAECERMDSDQSTAVSSHRLSTNHPHLQAYAELTAQPHDRRPTTPTACN